MSDLIWFQTVSKCYQQAAKLISCKEVIFDLSQCDYYERILYTKAFVSDFQVCIRFRRMRFEVDGNLKK